jgi:hypothetical protein
MIVRSVEDVSDLVAADGPAHCSMEKPLIILGVPSRNWSRSPAPPLNTGQVQSSLSSRTDRNASCEISTFPTCFIRFLPSFCFSRSFRLREMSPP